MKNRTSALFTPLFVSVIFFLMTVSEKLLRLASENGSDIILSASVIQLFIFAIPAAFYCKIRKIDFLGCAKVRHMPFSNLSFVVSAAFTYLFTAIIVLYIEFNFMSVPSQAIPTVLQSEASPFGLALSYVIIPAIAEELFFRSIILSDYEQYKGPVAVIVSALFFAMLHFSFAQFPFYFILGIILATITYVTGSSFPAVIIHLINNTGAVFLGDALSSFLRESSSSIILVFLLVVAFMVSLATMLSALEEIYDKKSELYDTGDLPGSRREALGKMAKAGKMDSDKEKTIQRKAEVFLSPTFFLSIFLFVLITLDII